MVASGLVIRKLLLNLLAFHPFSFSFVYYRLFPSYFFSFGLLLPFSSPVPPPLPSSFICFLSVYFVSWGFHL
jgi:hypothetical protein